MQKLFAIIALLCIAHQPLHAQVVQELNTRSAVKVMVVKDGIGIPQVAALPTNPALLNYNSTAATGSPVWCSCAADTLRRGLNIWNGTAWETIRAAISLTTTGTSGAATFNSITGVLNIPNYSSVGGGGLNKVDSVTTVGDSLFYDINGTKYFVTNIATSAAGGDTTIFEIVLDSTGQPNRRVLFSETGNRIGSDNTFLWDKVNNKLVINGTNVSIGGPTAKLVVVGRAVFGVVNTDALQVQALTEVTDTSAHKPLAVDASGIAYKMNRWPGGISYPYTSGKYLNAYGTFAPLNTDSVPEGSTNKYFTNAQARAAIGLTTTGSSGAATYDSSTGILNIPAYSIGGLGGVPTSRTITINGTTLDLSADRSWTISGGGGGITSIGTFAGTGDAKGLSVSGTDLIMHPATATTPGGVSTGPQTWVGNKTFQTGFIIDGGGSIRADAPGVVGGRLSSTSSTQVDIGSAGAVNVNIKNSSFTSSLTTIATNTNVSGNIRVASGTGTLSFDAPGVVGGRWNIFSSGSTTIGGNTEYANAMLAINSTNRGLLLPRLNISQRAAIAGGPTAGLMIYCTDCTATDGSTGVTQTYNGSTWKNHW